MQSLFTFLIGILAGNITGLIGSSGVMIVVPAFMILGYSPASSIGASLFIDTIASIIVAWTYYQNKNLILKEGFWIAIGSVIGAQIGSFVSVLIPTQDLGDSFSIFLFISAVLLWVNGKENLISDDSNILLKNRRVKSVVEFVRGYPRIFGLALGLIVGVISGFFGAGGGVMILFILVLIMGFNMHEGIGTSTLIMAFTAASGTVGHVLTSELPLKIAIFGTLGTVIGGRISAKYANKVNDQVLCKIGAVLFAVLGGFLLYLNKRA